MMEIVTWVSGFVAAAAVGSIVITLFLIATKSNSD